MNYPPPTPPPYGQGGDRPPGQPPSAPTWPAPAGPPPRRSRTGLTLGLLAAGLVLVLVAIGVVALAVRGGDEDGAGDADAKGGGAHEASCEVYADVVLSSEVWAATSFDPDKLQEVYDTALADITDDAVGALVEEESRIVVSYYRALHDWKQAADDALADGEIPDTQLPAEVTAQQGRIAPAQRAVIDACQDVLPGRGDQPAPRITAPTLERPTWMDGQ